MSAQDWTRIAEVGSVKALRVGGWLARCMGRRFMHATLWFAALYFLIRKRAVRRASRQYLARLRASTPEEVGRADAPGMLAVLRHLHSFAINIYERVLMWSGELELAAVEHDGSAHLFELDAKGRSALLLGAHLGNVDILWSIARQSDLTVNVVVFYRNAERINSLFESLAPGARLRVIEIDPDSVNAAFQIKACLDRGEFVVILADRMPPLVSVRSFEAQFLGAQATFPASPFLAATVLGCPVYFAACLRTGERSYKTILRPLAPGERVPRAERDKCAREILERYVTNLELYCREQPLQWFNFFEFWKPGES